MLLKCTKKNKVISKVNKEASEEISQYIETADVKKKEMLQRLRDFLNRDDFELTEDWKWRAPIFNSNGMVCWLAFFKSHIGLNFFKGALIEDLYGLFDHSSMDKGNRIIKYKTIDEIDENLLEHYVNKAIKLNIEGIKVVSKKVEIEVPNDLAKAFEKQTMAKDFFISLAPGYKRDYIHWITSAKQEKTRLKRLETSIEWLGQGKKKNWKYQKC